MTCDGCGRLSLFKSKCDECVQNEALFTTSQGGGVINFHTRFATSERIALEKPACGVLPLILSKVRMGFSRG